MTFKLIKSNQVGTLFIGRQNWYGRSKNTTYQLNKNTLEKVWEIETVADYQFEDSNSVILYEILKGNTIIIENKSGRIVKILERTSSLGFINNQGFGYLSYNDYISFQKEIGFFDFTLLKSIWQRKIEYTPRFSYCDDFCIYYEEIDEMSYSRGIINAFSRSTGDLLWERDLSELWGEGAPWQIGRIIGVFEQVLTVMIRWETMEQLVGLEVATGQVRWHLKNTHDPQTGEVVFPNIVPCLGQMQASADGRRLYGLRYNVFIEIEPATGNILRLHRFGPVNSLHFTHEGKEISIKNTRLHEGYFYFTATLQGETFSSGLLGAFDIVSEQIVWLHDMGFTRSGQFFNEGAAPVLDGNRLYALDGEGTLHIFEKELNHLKG